MIIIHTTVTDEGGSELFEATDAGEYVSINLPSGAVDVNDDDLGEIIDQLVEARERLQCRLEAAK